MNKILVILKEIIHEVVQFKQPVLIILQYFNSITIILIRKKRIKKIELLLQYYINFLSISSPYRLWPMETG